MRRWIALPAVALLGVAAAACGNDPEATADGEQAVVTDGLDQAVEVARLSIPGSVDDELVTDLVEGLCRAAGSGDAESVATRLQASGLDPAEVLAVLDAVAAGAGTYCRADVDDVVPQVQQALAPAPTTAEASDPAASAAADAAASAGSGSGSASGTGGGAAAARTSGSSSSGGSGGAAATSGPASSGASNSSGSGTGTAGNTSSGSATAGAGGNATGTGNHSSTGLTQGVGGGSASNQSSAG